MNSKVLMTDLELELQKKVVVIFQEIQVEKELLGKKVSQLGYSRRNALISHVYSNYTKHEKLNALNNEWEKTLTQYNILKWLLELFVEHRDLMGYFENYSKLKEDIRVVREDAITKEKYEIAEVLTIWQNKLPDY